MEVERERLNQIDGAMPRLNAIPKGCAFNPRCPQVFEKCRHERPELAQVSASADVSTQVACWLRPAVHQGSAS
jgi:peptide/nickel transport system ATP-binding protein